MGPALTGTGIKVHANTAQSCAAFPARNTKVLFVHKPSVLHSLCQSSVLFPASGSPRGCPAHGLSASPHRSDPPHSSSRQRLPAAAGGGGFWPSCGASGSRFTLSKAIRQAQDLSAVPGAAGQHSRVVCHTCHCPSHPPRHGASREPRVRWMRQINTQFPCTALGRQAGHTTHSWKHPAASAAQAAAAHAGQVPGPSRKAQGSPQGPPSSHPALSTLELLAEGSALAPPTLTPVGPRRSWH